MSEGDFEGYGGRHVPDAPGEPLERLADAYDEVSATDEFRDDLRGLLEEFAGRPTPLYYARNLSERYDAEIYLKREDLLHGGVHKINNIHESVALVGQPEPMVLVTRSARGCSRGRPARSDSSPRPARDSTAL